MKPRLPLLIAALMACGAAAAKDGFDGLRCDADIAKALAGRHLSNDRVDVLEARHKDLSLKHLGSEELDWGGEEWWQLCGATYSLLVDQHGLIRDALKIPPQEGTAAFEGACKGVTGELIGAAENQPGAADLLIKTAWKIDDAKKRFVAVPVPAEGVLCARDGLVGGP
jgi:hypothetical protein